MKRFFLTFVLVAILAVAATTFCCAQPAQNVPAPAVVNDWSALDQPVDAAYIATHSSTHGLQAVVAEIRATLSSLVQQFRILVGRVDKQGADIVAIKLQLGMTDNSVAPDKKDTPAAAGQSDDKKPGAEEGTSKPPETQTGSAETAPAPAPAEGNVAPQEEGKAPAQAGAGAPSTDQSGDRPGDGSSDIAPVAPVTPTAPAVVAPVTPAPAPTGAQPKAGTPTRGEQLENDVSDLATGQAVLVLLALAALAISGIAFYNALLANRGVVNIAKSTHFALGNGKGLAEGGTFPDDEDVYKNALVAAWLERGGAPLEPAAEPGDLADEAAEAEGPATEVATKDLVAGPAAEEAAKPEKTAPKKKK